MCKYLYTCMYIYLHVYIHIQVYIFAYIYICICMYVCIYMCVYIHIYMHTYIYMYIHIHIDIYMYIYIYIYVYVYILERFTPSYALPRCSRGQLFIEFDDPWNTPLPWTCFCILWFTHTLSTQCSLTPAQRTHDTDTLTSFLTSFSKQCFYVVDTPHLYTPNTRTYTNTQVSRSGTQGAHTKLSLTHNTYTHTKHSHRAIRDQAEVVELTAAMPLLLKTPPRRFWTLACLRRHLHMRETY